MLILIGCGHSHSWKEADCVTPRTCVNCGEIEGEALGHTWKTATCTTAKTCSSCNAIESDILGHTWTNATSLLSERHEKGY